MLNTEGLPMVGIQDTETHLRWRRNWTCGLGPAAIGEYEPFIAKCARQLVDRLEENTGIVAIGNWFNLFSYVHRARGSLLRTGRSWHWHFVSSIRGKTRI